MRALVWFQPPFHCHLISLRLLWLLALSFLAQAEEIAIDPWVIPMDNLPYPPRSAVKGDLISFHYRGNHNVYVALNSGSSGDNNEGENSIFKCDTQDAIQVGATGAEFANYTLTLSDGIGQGSTNQSFTSVTFFCNYTSHCERGQQLQFNVYSSREDIPPTQAPSMLPTLNPTTSAPSIIPTVEVTAPPFAPLFNTTFAPTPASAAVCVPWFAWNLSGLIACIGVLISFYSCF